MRRRRIVLAAGLLAVAALAAGLGVWLACTRPRVTPENFRRLRLGMTRPQVEHILGPPHGPGPVEYALVWEGEGLRVTLDFAEPGGRGTLVTGDLTFLDSAAKEAVWLPASLGGDDGEITLWDRLRSLLPW